MTVNCVNILIVIPNVLILSQLILQVHTVILSIALLLKALCRWSLMFSLIKE